MTRHCVYRSHSAVYCKFIERRVVEDAIYDFCEDARGSMQSRMFQAVDRGWGLSWRDGAYTDEQVLARLRRAVDHLEAALRNTDDRHEWEKRAADVANQAFMAADPKRRDAPREGT